MLRVRCFDCWATPTTGTCIKLLLWLVSCSVCPCAMHIWIQYNSRCCICFIVISIVCGARWCACVCTDTDVKSWSYQRFLNKAITSWIFLFFYVQVLCILLGACPNIGTCASILPVRLSCIVSTWYLWVSSDTGPCLSLLPLIPVVDFVVFCMHSIVFVRSQLVQTQALT